MAIRAVLVPAVVFFVSSPILAQLDFRRGDTNTDGVVNLSDALASFDALFAGGSDLSCMDAADSNDDGTWNISDPIHTLTVLFVTGDEFPAPGSLVCGPDLSVDVLGCVKYNCPLFPRPEPDPCDQLPAPCECAQIGSTIVVSTTTEFGVSTVVTDGEGTVTPLEWIAEGPNLELGVKFPDGQRAVLTQFEGTLPTLGTANVIGAFLCGSEDVPGNHSGCDGFPAFFSCLPWGGCCDDHDVCIDKNCTGPNDSGDVRVWFRRWSSFVKCRLHGGTPEDCAAQFPPFTPQCEACHATVIAWFALITNRPLLGRPSNCCIRGDCGALQQCIIDDVVETDCSVCKSHGIDCDFGPADMWGDPHLVTSDRLAYDFQGVGEFILTRSVDDNLEIQARMCPWGSSRLVSVSNVVAMSVLGDRVTVRADPSIALHVNGTPVVEGNTAFLPGGGLVLIDGKRYTVLWPDGSRAEVQNAVSYLNLQLWLHRSRRGRVEGLLGNFDGEIENELVTRDGPSLSISPTLVELYRLYGESWRITQEESLFDYADGTTSETCTDREFPIAIARVDTLSDGVRSEAERLCRDRGITDPFLLEACILDVGFTGDAAFVESAAAAMPPNGTMCIEGGIIVSVYTGHTQSGGGAPYSGLVGAFIASGVSFATETGYAWHPFGLGDFGASITGGLSVPIDGDYTFSLNSDDGSLLLIEGAVVVDAGGVHGPDGASGSTFLTAGIHSFEVQFFECCGGPSGVDLTAPEGVSYVSVGSCK